MNSKILLVKRPVISCNVVLQEISMPQSSGRSQEAGQVVWYSHLFQNFRYADGTTLMAESKEELKSLLMKVKEESEKKK